MHLSSVKLDIWTQAWKQLLLASHRVFVKNLIGLHDSDFVFITDKRNYQETK